MILVTNVPPFGRTTDMLCSHLSCSQPCEARPHEQESWSQHPTNVQHAVHGHTIQGHVEQPHYPPSLCCLFEPDHHQLLDYSQQLYLAEVVCDVPLLPTMRQLALETLLLLPLVTPYGSALILLLSLPSFLWYGSYLLSCIPYNNLSSSSMKTSRITF